MATNWPTLPYNESTNSVCKPNTDINHIKMGDQYIQRVVNGMIFNNLEYKVVYDVVQEPEVTILRNFLNTVMDGRTIQKHALPYDNVLRYWYLYDHEVYYTEPTVMKFVFYLRETTS